MVSEFFGVITGIVDHGEARGLEGFLMFPLHSLTLRCYIWLQIQGPPHCDFLWPATFPFTVPHAGYTPARRTDCLRCETYSFWKFLRNCFIAQTCEATRESVQVWRLRAAAINA